MKKLNVDKYKNVLFIYPHPDDEILLSGGLMHKLAKKKNINVYSITVTKGEKGNEKYDLQPQELAMIRSDEFKKSLEAFRVKNYEQWDLPDGEVLGYEDEVIERINKFINAHSVDLIVTYERGGMYGHKDHVALSKFVRDISTERDVAVLYATMSRFGERILNIKKHITGLELDSFENCATPQVKLNVLSSYFTKYRAIRSYRSQNLKHGLPIWFKLLILTNEYYTYEY